MTSTQPAHSHSTDAIVLDRVVKRYGPVTAVDGVSLVVPTGEICVLVGPSGCGKTTTLKMINRVIEPTAGRILVRGIDGSAANPVELRRSIGYVIQQVGLFPHMRVGENVAIALRLQGEVRAARRRRAIELLELVGLDGSLVDRWPAELSGGQQQRVGVARALAGDPDIVLMDEPFGAVDPLLRPQLQRELRALQSRLGKTIVLVTHDLSEALSLADRLVVMRKGRVEQVGVPGDILLKPATPFVRDFFVEVRGLPILRVLRAGDLAEPQEYDSHLSVPVGADATLLSLMEAAAHVPGAAPSCFEVRNDSGIPIGAIPIGKLLASVASALGGQARS